MRWRTFSLLVFLVVVCAFTAAASTVSITPLDDEITLSEEAVFQVTIANDEDISLTYTVYGLEVVWSVTPESRRFTLLPGQSRTTKVQVRPLGPFKPSMYGIKLFVDQSAGPNSAPTHRFEEEMTVILYPDEPQDYLPALGLSIDIPSTINPQEQVPVRLQLTNRNPLNLTYLRVRVQSEMPEFVQEQTIHISPREEKSIEFTMRPNPHQAPKEYTVFFVFERFGQTIKVVERKVTILPVTVPFVIDTTESTVLRKTFIQLKVTNMGNVQDTQKVKVPVSLWAALFTSGDVHIEREDGQRHLVWEKTLNPAESITIPYIINYRIPLYILIIALVLGVFYLYARSSVELRKGAVTSKSGEDGTLSEVKITLEVKNLSRKPMKDIIITDLVPGIANLEKGLELGTIKPTEVKHTPKGTKVIWSMAELDAHEHRLITYKIKTKLNILGTFSLPRASMEYKTARGRKRKAYSTIFRLG